MVSGTEAISAPGLWERLIPFSVLDEENMECSPLRNLSTTVVGLYMLRHLIRLKYMMKLENCN